MTRTPFQITMTAMIHKSVIFLSYLILPFLGSSQIVEWTQTYKPSSCHPSTNEYGNQMTVSDDDHIYFSGVFIDSMDADFGIDTFMLTGSGGGFYTGFVTKIDPSGNLVWAKEFEGDGSVKVDDIITDSDGNIWMVCQYDSWTMDFDLGPGVTIFTNSGANQTVILKMDSDANLIWAKQLGTVANAQRIYALTLDEQNSAYLTGRFSSDLDVDLGSGVYTISSGPAFQAFVLKLDYNGNFQWVTHTSGVSPALANPLDIEIDADKNLYISGWIRDSVNFDPSGSSFHLYGNGYSDAFIWKIDSTGQFIWAQKFGGSDNFAFDMSAGLTLDNLANIYVTGSYKGNVDFDQGPGTTVLSSNTSSSAFLAKLSTDGDLIWANDIHSSWIGIGIGLELDCANNPVVGGRFDGTIDLDPGPTALNYSGQLREGFIAKYLSTNGSLLWGYKVGGSSNDEVFSIKHDSENNIYMNGYYHDTVDFDPSPAIDNHPSINSFGGLFVQKFSGIPCNTVDLDICTGDSVLFANDTLTSSGVYSEYFASINGIDSFSVLNLTVNIVDTSVSVSATVLSAELSGAQYQWLNCNDDFSIIPGETSQTYSAGSNGSYAVEVTANGCTDTSACHNIVNVGFEENSSNVVFEVFPNPTNGEMTINLGSNKDEVIVSISTISGELVQQNRYRNIQLINLTLNEAMGMYLMTIETTQNTKFIKVLLE